MFAAPAGSLHWGAVASAPASSRSTRDRPAKPPLSERAVIDAALKVLREEGLEAVSMRRVAKDLDTGAASLYAYVKNRDDLYDLVFDEVTGLIPLPKIDGRTWRKDLRQLLIEIRAVFLAHPGLAMLALARIPTGGNALAVADTMMGLMIAGKVEPQRAAWAIDNLFMIVTADATENDIERELAAQGPHKAIDHDRLHDTFLALPADRFPHIAAHADALVNGDGDDRFHFAIDNYMRGLLAA